MSRTSNWPIKLQKTSVTEVETAALANYTCSVWESSHTLSFTAALTIHIPYNTSPGSMHTSPLYVLRYTTWPWLLPSCLGHSRKISCFSSTARTDFLIGLLLKTQYNCICIASALNPVLEAFGKHSRNLAMFLSKQLHFAVFCTVVFKFLPAHTDFQQFSGWETGYFPAMALYHSKLYLNTCSVKLLGV